MAAARPLRPVPEWDDRFTRMCGVSAVAHALVIAAVVLLSSRGGWKPLPMTAYTVEITDPRALGGRLPPGAPGRDLAGGPAHAPVPEPKGEPAPAADTKPEIPPTPVAKAEEPAVRVPDSPKPPEAKPAPRPPEPKAAEPKPLVKPAPKPEPKRSEASKTAPVKPEAHQPEPAAKPDPRAAPGRAAAAATAPAAKGAANGASEPAHDGYAAAAERWRTRAGSGSGLGGTAASSGPIGAGGEGKGGGGQLVGLEFLAYRERVITAIKGRWTHLSGPGLVAAVRFGIAPDGEVSAVHLERSSGNPAYDGSALRAVQQANPLPAPPASYVKEFEEFVIEFHSEEHGGQEAG